MDQWVPASKAAVWRGRRVRIRSLMVEGTVVAGPTLASELYLVKVYGSNAYDNSGQFYRPLWDLEVRKGRN